MAATVMCARIYAQADGDDLLVELKILAHANSCGRPLPAFTLFRPLQLLFLAIITVVRINRVNAAVRYTNYYD